MLQLGMEEDDNQLDVMMAQVMPQTFITCEVSPCIEGHARISGHARRAVLGDTTVPF